MGIHSPLSLQPGKIKDHRVEGLGYVFFNPDDCFRLSFLNPKISYHC